MSDNEGTAAQGPREDEQHLEGEIQKEINKLKYFLEETDDLIQIKDYKDGKKNGKCHQKSRQIIRSFFPRRRVKNRQRRISSISNQVMRL